MSKAQVETPVRRRRDSRATKRAILDAAESIFVARGFDATSTSEIADTSKVTKSLIHHHFGSKEALWLEVKKRRLAAFSVVQKEVMAIGEADPEDFDKAVRSFFAFLQENPEYVRLSAWMYLEDPRLSEPADPELLDIAMRRIESGQRSGHFRRDVAARHILASFISLCSHWFLARHGYEHLAGAQATGKAADQAYLEDMLKIFLSGVLPR